MPVSRREFLGTALLGGLAAMQSADAAARKPRRPNLVFIMTDNQGAWTLGAYGNPDIRTPHIDRVAREGMRFDRAFAVNAVCSPTRASFLTGLMPSQHGVHCWLRANHAQMGPDAYSTIREFGSISSVLANEGYTCGLVGKWHLGDNLHPQQGFSTWITKPHGHTTAFYDVPIIQNGRIRNEPMYTTELWTRHACQFIEQNQHNPFFLYLPYNGPYGLGRSLKKPARNRHAATYADKTLPSFPRLAPHPWLHNNKEYLNNIRAIRRYAAECSGVDDGVGQVLATLDRLGLDDNTLVVYTADQGWAAASTASGAWATTHAHSTPSTTPCTSPSSSASPAPSPQAPPATASCPPATSCPRSSPTSASPTACRASPNPQAATSPPSCAASPSTGTT